MQSPKSPLKIFYDFMRQMPNQEKQYIQKIKKQKELWQTFQQAYANWQVENKGAITHKSPLLTAVKESLSTNVRN